ncbi:MAG: ATP-binding protein [Sphingomonadales bacterium]|nr:ATP-binding protein [Sphingomonadales bacterium]
MAMVLVQATIIDTGLTPNSNAIWLYSGIASLLLGSRLLNPYFTPPADSLTNAFAALLAIIPAAQEIAPWTPDAYVLGAVIAYAALLSVVAIGVLLTRPAHGIQPGMFWRLCDRAVKGVGDPHIIFTVLVIASAWLFHRDKPVEVFAILATLTVIVVIKPLESVAAYLVWWLGQPKVLANTDAIGTVVAHQSPGIVLIRQAQSQALGTGVVMRVTDPHGPELLGIALNYVGRDEGNLLRVLTTSMPQRLAGGGQSSAVAADVGMALPMLIDDDEAANISTLQWIKRLRGIVDSDSSPDYLLFEVIDDDGIAEGCLAEVRVGDERQVIYQVIDGVTREEVVQQKNKYGYARAKARKIGAWDAAASKFVPVPWMPRLNSPVFLMESDDAPPAQDCIGHFPRTPYGVRVDVSECVTHNTAILGILGVGKSFLAIELVERMIAQGIKVLCLDLTNQYATLLSDFIDPAFEDAKRAELVAAGKGGVANQNKELGGSRNAFKRAVLEQVRAFVTGSDDHYLRVFNPAQFRVTKQASGMYQGNADLAHLTASEITAIFSDAALFVCQELGMTDKARLCLVYEEAHSLVPEWNSVAADGDKSATATSARAILQGRKYGLGCLLITQRTANVTKTILNQCNTVFAMRTFDDTGKDFLGNYIGSDYASVLPSLQPRHAVIFGKGSSCENPVLIRLNDQEAFRQVFRAANPPKVPTPQPQPDDVGVAGDVAAEGTDDTAARPTPSITQF